MNQIIVMAVVAAVQLAIFLLLRGFWLQVGLSALSLPILYWVFGAGALSTLVWFVPLMVFFSAMAAFGLWWGIVCAAGSAVAVVLIFWFYIQIRTAYFVGKHKQEQPAA